MSRFTASLILLDSLCLFLGAFLILWRRETRRPPWLWDLSVIGFSSLCFCALSVAGSYVHMKVGDSHFSFFWKGAVIVIHMFAIIPSPLLILCGVLRLRSPSRFPGILLIMTGFLTGGTYLYARYVEPYRLQVRHYSITTELVKHPVKILVLSDLQTDHVGDFERKVFDTMDEIRADLILLTGDFIQLYDPPGYAKEVKKLQSLFRGMAHEPPLGIFAVEGHTDRSYKSLMNTGIPILNDEVHRIPGERIQLIGLTPRSSGMPLGEETLQQARDFDGMTIVFAHTPDFAQSLLDGSVEDPLLCVAGHTHGGQVVIPGFGPPVTFSRLPRKYAGGFHPIGNGWLMVSRGVGMERHAAPRVRFFCPPELVVIEIKPPT